MAQVMSRKMRAVLEPTGSEAPLEGVITEKRRRLVQNSRPKIALQFILGVMALCAGASWATMRTGRILPHAPCSIAGVVSLMADKEFWKKRASVKKTEWGADRLFCLEERKGKFGIYFKARDQVYLVSWL